MNSVGSQDPERFCNIKDAGPQTPPNLFWCVQPKETHKRERELLEQSRPLPLPTGRLTPELLISQALLMGQQEGEQSVQVGGGAPGHDVKEDGPVEDFEDGGRLGCRSFGALWLLPRGGRRTPGA